MAIIAELLGRSPTARRALDLLVSTPGHELHTREIARRIDADPHSTHGALDHLLQAGALTSRRVGNLRVWSVDASSDRVAGIGDLLRREGRVTQILARGLEEMRGIRIALIFGSFASGRDSAGSDIDVLLVGAVDWDRLARLSDAVSDHVSRAVNFVVWSLADVRNPKPGQRRLLQSILSGPRIMLRGDAHELTAGNRRMAAAVRGGHRPDRKQSEAGPPKARARGRPREPGKGAAAAKRV
ncbi:MAG: nucleotidyltransferase domain-containing protein [Candidatus Limnocylindria bacterium]